MIRDKNFSEEAYKWLEEGELQYDIWDKKYRYNNESFSEWLDRVSGGNEEIKKLIFEKKFSFGGRILANRELDKIENKKITYSNCFLAGTKVLTKNGYKNIEDVVVGDLVLTHDNTWKLVNETMKRDYCGDIYRIESPYILDSICCTPNHKFLTSSGEWKEACELVYKSDGHTKIDELVSSEFLNQDLLNQSLDTTDKPICQPNEKLVFKNNEEDIELEKQFIKIENISVLHDVNTTVYNLSVEDNHSYLVNGVFAHNCYVITPPEDSLESIFECASKLARTFSYGG